MLFQTRKSQNSFIVLFFVSTLLLSACAANVQAEQLDQPEAILITEEEDMVQPETSDGESVDEEVVIISHEEARDIAVAHLVEKFSMDKPSDWYSKDQIPEGLLGASDFLYTADAWVVRIQAPVVAPEYMTYSVEVDNIAVGLHWEGSVDAWGTLEESHLSGPMEVLSPTDARDAAAAYISAEYGWEQSTEWVEQSMTPIENAGVRHTFTSGPWVVTVDYYAAAPIVPGYHVVADHMSLVARWEGRISAEGEITEEAYVSE